MLVYLFSQQNWAEFWTAAGGMTAWRIGLAFALTMLSRLAVSGRWHALLRSAGAPIPWRDSLRITFAGLFASNFLPTTIGGDVVRLGGAARLGYDQAVCLASLVVDRLVGMAGMAMAAGPMLFLLPGQWSLGGASSLPLFGMAGGRGSGWLAKLWASGLAAWQRLLGALRLWLTRPGSLLLALACTWLHMLSVFLSIWVLLPGLGEQAPLWLIGGLWSLTYFVTLLPVSINGMGVQELTITFFFTTFAGISAPGGLALAVLMRLLPLLASLPGALFMPGILAGDRQQSL